MVKNLKDTPFSIDRLFVWAVGICLVASVLGIVALSILGKEIPRPLQSIATFSLGAFVGRIQEKKGLQNE